MRPFLLLAEDDAELREIYSGFLAQQGYDLAVAENGLDCLHQLRQARPDVLVLDLNLTWGGGDGVLDWLRTDGASFDIPVIVTATAGCQPCAADVGAWPVVEFLAKPFTLTKLAASVAATIARARPQSNHSRQARDRSEVYIG